MEKENESKDAKTNKKYKGKDVHIQSYLSKLLNKKVKCTLLNLDIIEGTLIGINQYEIAMLIADEQVIIFKHGIFTIKSANRNDDRLKKL